MRGFLVVGLSLAVTVGLAQPVIAAGPAKPHRLTVQKSPSVWLISLRGLRRVKPPV